MNIKQMQSYDGYVCLRWCVVSCQFATWIIGTQQLLPL